MPLVVLKIGLLGELTMLLIRLSAVCRARVRLSVTMIRVRGLTMMVVRVRTVRKAFGVTRFLSMC